MITSKDIERQLYPEINHTQVVEDRHISHLFIDCIEWVISDTSKAQKALFLIAVFMVILFWE